MSNEKFLSLKERRAAGQRRRDLVSREDQALWKPSTNRPSPVKTVLAAATGRMPDLIPIKMGRMALSPFAFFRGAAPVMAADLALCPTSGVPVQLCGDAHVRNLGAFAAPDGHLVFDINDFDETIPGPWEWDLKRLAASIVLAGREAGDGDKVCVDAVRELVRHYRKSLRHFSRMTFLEVARYEIRRHSTTPAVRAVLDKAQRATPSRVLRKLTEPAEDGTPRFHDRPPLLEHVPDEMADKVLASLAEYRGTLNAGRQALLDCYHPVDVAFKVVGTGSVGTRDFVVLLLGNGRDDALFLQVKEELPSCYVPYLPDVPPCSHQGRRVAEGQSRMQTAATDLFLGWTTLDGKDFLVRQLADHKAAIEPSDLHSPALHEYSLVCGEALAKAHARTGDAAAIAGYAGGSRKLDKAMAAFAQAYAGQTEADYEEFKRAIQAGQITAA